MRSTSRKFVCRSIMAGVLCLVLMTPAHGTFYLAPKSQIKRNSVEMVLRAMITLVREKLQRGEVSPDALWEILSDSLAREPQEIRSSVEFDRGLPIKASQLEDGTWSVDATLWVKEKPVRIVCRGGECAFLASKLPLLMDRVIARGGRVLEREIPPGPLKSLFDICRENSLHDLMVYGGAVRNLLLERENIKGDTDIFIWTRLTPEEKAQAQLHRRPLYEIRDAKQRQVREQLGKIFNQDVDRIILEGSPLHFIGKIDEDNVCYAAFARGFMQPIREIPGINVDNIGIHLDNLKVYDPVGGLGDLSGGVLRFCGADLEGSRGINYREALRILRLESQLAPWGAHLDERTAKVLQRVFTAPSSDSTRMLVDWAAKIAALKDFYPDLEKDVLEIRRIREKAKSNNLTSEESHYLAQIFDRLNRYVIAYDMISAGQEPQLSQEQFDRAVRAKKSEVDSIIRNSCVNIDLETGKTKNDTYEIGSFIVQLYQGAENPYAITARLRQLGLEPILKAIGIHLEPFTHYAYRVWAEDRIKEVRFDRAVQVGQRMAIYPMRHRIVKIPLHAAHSPAMHPKEESYVAAMASYKLAIERLGGLIPPTTVLKNIRIPKSHIANAWAFVSQVQAHDLGNEIELPVVIAQDMPGENLKDRALELKRRGDTDGLRRLMGDFIYYQVQLWKRGVINTDYRLESYRMDGDGQILLFNLSKLSAIDPRKDYTHHTVALRHFFVEYFDHLVPGLGTRFSSLAFWSIQDVELRKAFSERNTTVPAEDAHWPRRQIERLENSNSAVGTSL